MGHTFGEDITLFKPRMVRGSPDINKLKGTISPTMTLREQVEEYERVMGRAALIRQLQKPTK